MSRTVVKTNWVKVPCDICGSSDFQSLSNREYRIQHKTKNFIMELNDVMCSDCGFVFAAKRPDEDFLLEYYSDAHDSYDGDKDVAVDYDSEVRIEVIRAHVPEGASILEVGAGAGHFCRYLSENGYKAEGLDPKEQAEKPGLEKSYIRAGDTNEKYTKKKYDAIISYYVMEHLRSPNEWLSEVLKFLKPTGYVIIEVPDFSTHPLECLNDEHLLHYRTEHLQALLRKHGLRIIQEDAPKSRYFGFTVVAQQAEGINDNLLEFDLDIIKKEAREKYSVAARALEERERKAKEVSLRVISTVEENPATQICFWGANEYASRIIKNLAEQDLNTIMIDNATSKIGFNHEGFDSPTISPSSKKLGKEGKKLFILCSPAWNNSIVAQIEEMMFEEYVVVDGVTAEIL